jgi:hypothetical protein
MPIFSLIFFGENILKIITLVPGIFNKFAARQNKTEDPNQIKFEENKCRL